MLINYFDQYIIDTDDEKNNIKEKLNIISQYDTENASFFNRTFQSAITYLFKPAELKKNQLTKGIPKHIDGDTTVIFFDNLLEEDKILEEYDTIANQAQQLIIVGNHESRRINDKIICFNIHHFYSLKKLLKEISKIQIGFHVNHIHFDRYYYGRMRTYFLNVLNSLSKLSIDDLKRNVEGECTQLLLKEDNYILHHHLPNSNIKMKNIINVYSKLLKTVGKEKVMSDEIFYLVEGELDDYQISKLNAISELFWLYATKEKEEIVSYAYDKICAQMLEEATKLQYCNFVNNVCASARYTDNTFPNSKENGCCNNTYQDRKKNCRYLKEDHSCAICSISCRVFTCAYLQKKGIDHSLWQYPIIDCVFSRLARPKIVYGFFIPREKMMKKL